MQFDIDNISKYVLKLDKEPNLYFIKMNSNISNDAIKKINEGFKFALDVHCPGSHIVILTEAFSPIIMPNDEIMKELGWARIVKEKENEVEN